MIAISLDEARALVARWRQILPLAPASVCLTLMEIESSFRPGAHAIPSAEALARGVHPAGAWGLLQLLQPTAADMARRVSRILRDSDPDMPPIPATTARDVAAALDLWDPAQPACLANPSLGSLLGVAYLDTLAERFGPRVDRLAAAYHNGPGFLRDFLADGKALPDDMPPKGKAYVERALALWPKYADDDLTPAPAPAAVA
jgi:soluble lytic murein transglycosylase-like protein